jgi:hypothetical protein
MATSEEVRTIALDLADRGTDTETAVQELLACCGDHRVSVVVARRALTEDGDGNGDRRIGRAVELLDHVLAEGSWA